MSVETTISQTAFRDTTSAAEPAVDLHGMPAPGCGIPVPQDPALRRRARQLARRLAEDASLTPPLAFDELQRHADYLLEKSGIDDKFRDFLTVLVGNAAWLDTIAAVPYARRILLLPLCLRTKAECPAEIDEFGLLCQQCGRCPLGALQEQAEALGYVVLIAEGTTVVKQLLEQGKIDAVIGAGCMTSLERSFPYMAADAIPGLAIPLVRDGCDRTQVDLEWLQETITLSSGGTWRRRLDVDSLRSKVQTWFAPHALQANGLGSNATETERIAIEWLALAGKRWRPFLAVAVYNALRGTTDDGPPMLRSIGLAVECFHKASLVHDDIEDDDDLRYGEKTLHCKYGVPVALNAGDLLLGEGYRLIANCGAAPEQTVQMLQVAAEGHRDLCLGQGEELCWTRNPVPLSVADVIRIFQRKTAPAFDVALRLGAIAATGDESLRDVLSEFSRALGIAYQIKDDLEDFDSDDMPGDAAALRPSLLMAIAHDRADERVRKRLLQIWQQERSSALPPELREAVAALDVQQDAQALLDSYRKQAFEALAPLRSVELKSLLHRLTNRILNGA